MGIVPVVCSGLPRRTREAAGKCPVCGRPVTVGVLHRLEMLADRAEEGKPPTWRPSEHLVPLTGVIAAAEGVGEQTQRVRRIYERLLAEHGPELTVLRRALLEAGRDGG